MAHVRALRLSRGLTLTELALMTGIPARALAMFEHGIEPLDQHSRLRLAAIFNTSPAVLTSGVTTPQVPPGGMRLSAAGVASAVALGLAGALLLASPGRANDAAPIDAGGPPALVQLDLPLARPPAPQQLRPVAMPAIAAPPITGIKVEVRQPYRAERVEEVRAEALAHTYRPPPPQPLPPPAFVLLDDGPHGCPLLTPGRVFITQGYGVGTHAPADIWGAVDLAIDSNGDGWPESANTFGTGVVATLGGVAHVFPNSWPGGNFVLIVNAAAGWSVAYAHLDTIAVVDGQTVEAGALVGTVGTTGMTTGPHLHYEVRSASANIDPAPLIGCAG